MLSPLLFQWLSTFYVGGVSFGVTVFLARSLGPEGFGSYALALSVGAIAMIFIDGGMRGLLLRELVRPTPGLASVTKQLPGFALAHTAMVVTALGVAAIVYLPTAFQLLGLATIACFASSALTQSTSAILRAKGLIRVDAIFQIGGRTVTAVAIVCAVTLGANHPTVVLAVWALAGALYLLPFSRVWALPSFTGIGTVWNAALPFATMDLAITLYIRASVALMERFGVETATVGHYAAAFRICEAFVMLAGPIGLVFFRRRRAASHMEDATVEDVKLIIAACFCSLGVAAVVSLNAHIIIPLIYGGDYARSVEFLSVMGWMVAFILPNTLLNQINIASNREWRSVSFAWIVAFINIFLNILFIPKYGAVAVAWVCLFSEALVFLGLLGSLALDLSKRKKQYR
jgi:O-antigen/teichoic acid export membrane protein